MPRFRSGSSFVKYTQCLTKLGRPDRVQIVAYSEELERATKAAGQRSGVLGQSGLRVLRCLLFDFHSIATGLCVPGYAAIRAKTGFCFTTISGALDRLAGAGIITVIKRLGWADLDRKIVKQMTNAYIFRKPPTEKVAITPNRSQPRSLRFNLESKAVRAVQAVANPVVKTLQGGLDAALASLGAAIHAKSG